MPIVEKSKLEEAFKELEEEGFEAHVGPFWCCQTCACADITSDRFVYWHEQDEERRLEGEDLYLGWGETEKDGETIVMALLKAGLAVSWGNDVTKRIKVHAV